MARYWGRGRKRRRFKPPPAREFATQRYDGRNLVGDVEPERQIASNLSASGEAQQKPGNPLGEQINQTATDQPEPEILPPPRKFGGYQENAGRPAFEPTDNQRALVRSAFGWGVRQDRIAEHLGIAQETLKKYFAKEIADGRFAAHMTIGQNIYKQASKDTLAAFSWAKLYATSQMGWKETLAHEVTGADGKPIEVVDLSGLADDDLARLIELREKLTLAGGFEGGGGETESAQGA